MIAVVQRVRSASVTIDDQVTARIGRGLCVFISVVKEDTDEDLTWMAEKLVSLRVFPHDQKEFDQDLRQIEGEMLLISNFTVSAATRRGRRPSFEPAMSPAMASVMFHQFIMRVREKGVRTETGRFGSDMLIDLQNDGPVTLILNSRSESSQK